MIDFTAQYCTPHLEWESLPRLVITDLKFEKTNYGFDTQAVIEISRGPNYTLSGTIKGNVSGYENLNYQGYIGVGNIVRGQKICGQDNNGNIIEIGGCDILGIHTSSLNFKFVESGLSADSIKVIYSRPCESSNYTRMEWFVCQNFPAHLWGRTHRNPHTDLKKVRIGIDTDSNDTVSIIGSSFRKDHTSFSQGGLNFILSIVPDEVISGEHIGICIEFRDRKDSVDIEVLNGIKGFLSFFLGNEMTHIGNSTLNGDSLMETNAFARNISLGENTMPPIKFNTKYDWGDLSKLMDTYLVEYLAKRELFSFDAALSRYWIAHVTPLGANLPILASALEILAQSYLKQNKEGASEYLQESIYNELIGEELQSLRKKLSGIGGSEIILGKIIGAFRKGPNEKMNQFFEAIDIKIGKREKTAIALRNKMTHGSRDYSKDENIHNDLLFTRVYEVLFHRVLLKLIGYDGYYIDYSTQHCPSRHINNPAGEDAK